MESIRLILTVASVSCDTDSGDDDGGVVDDATTPHPKPRSQSPTTSC